MNKVLRRIWIVLKFIIAIWTVVTLVIFFIYLLPGILKMDVVVKNPWLPSTFTIVLLFWCIYLAKWIKKG